MTKTIKYYMELNYPIELIPHGSDDGIWYEASIPQLGRWTFNGAGDNPDEAIESLNQIKEVLFTQRLEKGKDIPEPIDLDEEFSGQFVLRMEKDLHKELVFIARDKGISLNTQINNILNTWKEIDNSSLTNNIEKTHFTTTHISV